MATGRRLFLLLPFAPRLDATHGGGRVVAQFLAEITVRHRVAVLYLREKDEPPLDDFFRDRCDLVEEVLRPSMGGPLLRRLTRCVRLVASSLRLRPMWVADWASEAFAKRAGEIARTFRPDIVQLEFHVMGQYLSALGDCEAPRVLTDHEPGIRAAPYLKRRLPIVSPLIDRLERLAWRRYESAVICRVQAVVVFTESDRRALLGLGNETPVYAISPGAVIPSQPLDPLGHPPRGLLFVGSFIHSPNIDAAIRLIRDIFPVVRKAVPETRLFIVGEHPPMELRQMAGENVVVTGHVPDVAPYLDRAALFVAPIYTGGGMRVKVLESLAAGKATVATPLAVEGLRLVDGEQVSIANSDGEFVERIVQLLRDEERRATIAGRARAWACANLGWDRSVWAYDALYAGLLENSSPVRQRLEGERRSSSNRKGILHQWQRP